MSEQYLLDVNVLARSVIPADPQHAVAVHAVDTLTARGGRLFITAQTMIEFWAVATRPAAVRGLGWDIAAVAAEIAQFRIAFAFLEDNPLIFQAWQILVTGADVEGKQVHDARIAAVALAHGVPNVLTFNVKDFRRFIPFGVTPIDPADIK